MDMLCAEASDALAPRAVDLKLEDLLASEFLVSDVHLKEVKFILNQVLPFLPCHFFWSLTRLGLRELAITSPVGFKPSLAHFN